MARENWRWVGRAAFVLGLFLAAVQTAGSAALGLNPYAVAWIAVMQGFIQASSSFLPPVKQWEMTPEDVADSVMKLTPRERKQLEKILIERYSELNDDDES